MISGGRLIGRAEDEVESVEREVVSWCLDIFGMEFQRKGLVQREEREASHLPYELLLGFGT